MENKHVHLTNLFLFFLQLPTTLLSASQLSPAQNHTMTTLATLLPSPSPWDTSNPDPCTWEGVTCDTTTTTNPSRVTRLSLSHLGINDTNTATVSDGSGVFALLCRLEGLESLDLSANVLTSTPAAFSSGCRGLTGLRSLNLSANRLSGDLPSFFSIFVALESLDLSFNRLEGEVDSQLEALVRLRSLNLSSNDFSGSIPTRLGNASALQELQLSRNRFHGSIPPELLGYKNLSFLDLSRNQISGSVPVSIQKLSKLGTLILSDNNISGAIPSLSTMESLFWFGANQNNFSGAIPLGTTKHLQNLDLSYNMIEGLIPSDLLSSQNLVSIDLSYNSLKGPIPKNLSLNLRRIRLGGNSLNGSIPSAIGELSELTYLELDDNNLEGEIPSQLWSCKKLALLNLAVNQLRGALPKELGNLHNLVVAKLEINHISGVIPDEVSLLGNLLTLNLSYNSLTGRIPSSISGLENLSSLNLESNQLNGSIPEGIRGLQCLSELQLGSNNLTAPIPEMPSSLAIALNLSNNEFSGPIAPHIGKLGNLEVLDLSNNRFTGEVPRSLTNMKSLTILVLSNNQLSGALPDFHNWVIVDDSGNKNLENGTTGSERRPDTSHHRRISVALVILVPIISAIVVLGLAIVLLRLTVVSRRFVPVIHEKSCENPQMITTTRLITRVRIHSSSIDFRKAMEAVCDQGNILWKTKFSTYYKATMPNGRGYSVKKLNWSDKILQSSNHAEFREEIEILGKQSNSNIMVPLAYFLTMDDAYLFYEHVHLGSIRDFLHDGRGDSFDWSSRYDVALGVAQGMAFLHGCNPEILLLDLTTKSILLKSFKEPQIGDIELSKVINPSNSIRNISTVAGSAGYIPPEYAYTMRVTMAGNVYSFGVVLLELLTGKLPVSEGTELAKSASSYSTRLDERECVLDPSIYKTSIRVQRQMLSVLRIALDCVSYSPEARPKMNTVVGSLLHAR